jgi:hypothetical protein
VRWISLRLIDGRQPTRRAVVAPLHIDPEAWPLACAPDLLAIGG